MKVLFVHQNFPGQYGHIAKALAANTANEVVALAINERQAPANVRVIRYKPEHGSSRQIHKLAADFETKMIRGEAAARAALKLKKAGFEPDVICAHPGWGEALFLRDVWPHARILSYCEFYYGGDNGDVGFDPEFGKLNDEKRWDLRAKNAALLLSLELSDRCVTPTLFQAQQIPAAFRDRVSVVHDGIDTKVVRPRPATVKLGSSKQTATSFGPDSEIVTFINRNLEPYRGYHSFMRALPAILAERPRARAVIVGGDGVSYGSAPPSGTWKARFLNEVSSRLDMSRVHFVGNIPYVTYLDLLNISSAHVYLTYPFVLSWSMLEAMATECLVIGSKTAPVMEVIEDGLNGLLVDFFSIDEIAARVINALAQPSKFRDLRVAARRTIQEKYDLYDICLPRQLALIEELAKR